MLANPPAKATLAARTRRLFPSSVSAPFSSSSPPPYPPMYPIVSGNTLSVHGESDVKTPAARTVAYVVAPTAPSPSTSAPMAASRDAVAS